MTDLQHAANYALWLLNQEQMKPIMLSNWVDPEIAKDLLIKAGCTPTRIKEPILNDNTKTTR